jgi:hypothetical protein
MANPITGKIVDIKAEDLRTPTGKVYELLERHFWTNGGWLSAVGEGADRIVVMTTRELNAGELLAIPKVMDGIPVEVVVTGIMQIG